MQNAKTSDVHKVGMNSKVTASQKTTYALEATETDIVESEGGQPSPFQPFRLSKICTISTGVGIAFEFNLILEKLWAPHSTLKTLPTARCFVKV